MSRTPRPQSLPLQPPKANEKLGDWLYRELRSAILEGRLRPGTLLPPTRTLARESGVSRGTVVAVFEQMIAEGYLESRPGSGTSVHRHLPDRFFEAPMASVSSESLFPADSLDGASLDELPLSENAGSLTRSPRLYGQPPFRPPLSRRPLEPPDFPTNASGYAGNSPGRRRRGTAVRCGKECISSRSHRGVVCDPAQISSSRGFSLRWI